MHGTLETQSKTCPPGEGGWEEEEREEEEEEEACYNIVKTIF